MITGDGAYIKKINRGLILREIIKHQAISRADLSKITGLNKATISVQVADLLKDELIYETEQEHHAVGRRPIMLSINRSVGYVLGIDLDYKHIQFAVSDLGGHLVDFKSIKPETENYNEIVDLLSDHIQTFQKKYSNSRYGLISVMIGIHGTVNNDETVDFVPTYQWHHKSLKEDLSNELDLKINIENNANLSAYAERVFQHHEADNLLTIILTSGIGAGIMIEGNLHKGYHGFAGEMGHMITMPYGKKCRCGNQGCWELYASETSLIKQLAKQFNRKNLTRKDVKKLIKQKDKHTIQQMQQFIHNLSIGLNNVINLYNPETLVLTSEILKLYPHSITEIKHNLSSSVSKYREIVISKLGNKSCVMGASALAIQQFLQVPELMITVDKKSIESDEEMKV